MKDDAPAWLKAAQNGSIGEARTRAFLLNRFWVLERSVDVDGADFVIERRLMRRHLFDRQAPRLGVVQVKFFDSEGTSHYIHREYIQDNDGNARPEFFVMCHSGDEEQPRAFLMTAREIMEHFTLVSDGVHEGRYRVGGAQLLRNRRFEIVNKRLALYRIEHTLELADFTRNRSFLSWLLPSTGVDESAIDPLYREPIANKWGDIPKEFVKLKQTVNRAMGVLEDIHGRLAKIWESTDPVNAFEVVEDLAYECRTPNGWNVSLPRELWDPDFETAAREHKEKVETLKGRGLLDTYIQFSAELKRQFADFLGPQMPLADGLAHVVEVTYDPQTLTDVTVASVLEDSEKYCLGMRHSFRTWRDSVLEARPGLIRYWWSPSSYAFDENAFNADREAYIREQFWAPYLEIMEAVYSALASGGMSEGEGPLRRRANC